MSKVYDPILCMLVDKKVSKARDGKKYILKINGKKVTEFEAEGAPFGAAGSWLRRNMPGKGALLVEEGTGREYTIGPKEKDSTVDRAIRAIDSEKGYEFDGFWIKPDDYGVEVTKNGKKVGEFDSTSEAEKWIRGKYGD